MSKIEDAMMDELTSHTDFDASLVPENSPVAEIKKGECMSRCKDEYCDCNGKAKAVCSVVIEDGVSKKYETDVCQSALNDLVSEQQAVLSAPRETSKRAVTTAALEATAKRFGVELITSPGHPDDGLSID